MRAFERVKAGSPEVAVWGTATGSTFYQKRTSAGARLTGGRGLKREVWSLLLYGSPTIA